jgi:hypothetical protein
VVGGCCADADPPAISAATNPIGNSHRLSIDVVIVPSPQVRTGAVAEVNPAGG